MGNEINPYAGYAATIAGNAQVQQTALHYFDNFVTSDAFWKGVGYGDEILARGGQLNDAVSHAIGSAFNHGQRLASPAVTAINGRVITAMAEHGDEAAKTMVATLTKVFGKDWATTVGDDFLVPLFNGMKEKGLAAFGDEAQKLAGVVSGKVASMGGLSGLLKHVPLVGDKLADFAAKGVQLAGEGGILGKVGGLLGKAFKFLPFVGAAISAVHFIQVMADPNASAAKKLAATVGLAGGIAGCIPAVGTGVQLALAGGSIALEVGADLMDKPKDAPMQVNPQLAQVNSDAPTLPATSLSGNYFKG